MQGLEGPHLSTGPLPNPVHVQPVGSPHTFPHSTSSTESPLTLGLLPAEGSTRDRTTPALPSSPGLELSAPPHYGEDGLTSRRSCKSFCFKQRDQPSRTTPRELHHHSLQRQHQLQRAVSGWPGPGCDCPHQGKRAWRPGIL